ncbi:MAG: SpoIIE family protein phosphatase [Spirochaetes bacterium]|nr:SpoIIE family protein phosphatase [Spirochaetota bacterium]
MKHHKKRVLVIEDEPIIRQGIADFLEDCNFEVLQAEHGKKGVELFRKFLPDVVLTDLRMPIMSGKEVLTIFTEEFPDVPIIVVSGVGDIRDAIEAIHLGAWDYIIKPVHDLEIILHAIEKNLERARLIKENREYRENLEKAKAIFERDLRMAINIQKNYLPKRPPISNQWDIAFEFHPMAGVSGDFYDFYEKETNVVGASLFDVSGHGIASGLITMIAKSIAFRMFISMQDKPLEVVMQCINDELIKEIDAMDNYLTGIIVRFADSKVEYVNAAHPPLLHRHASGEVEEVGLKDGYLCGKFLGIGALASEYTSYSFFVEKGDMLLLYSDCLVETMNAKKERYGIGRLARLLSALDPVKESKKLLTDIINDFYSFIETESLPDDLTVILIKRLV